MITVNKLPLNNIDKITKGVRSIGLGVMGFADLLYMLGIPYNSNEGYKFTNDLFKFMYSTARQTSIELAKEKGVYPLWEGSQWHRENIKIRNSNFLSIAPTGSISFIAGVSGGIEPNFALVYTRRTNEGDIYYIANSLFEQKLKSIGIYSNKLIQKVVDNGGSCQGIDEIPLEVQKVFVVASDIKPLEHVKMVGIIQKYVDLSISKTVNLPNSATVEDIMEVYLESWRQGIKGITVYRDGCRQNQTLAVKREDQNNSNELSRGQWKPKAEDTVYYERKVYIGCGKLKLMIGWSDVEKTIQDLYVIRSGNGGCERNLQGMVIAMSGMLRLGGNLFNIEKSFEGVGGCNSFVAQRTKGELLSKGNSCGTAILNEIKAFLKEKELDITETKENLQIKHNRNNLKSENKLTEDEEKYIKQYGESAFASKFSKCPKCYEKLNHTDGCISCTACGFSKCN